MTEHNASAVEQLTHRRFRFFLIVFRVSGIPILYNKVPKLFSLYATVAIFCAYITFVAIVADVFMNMEDLERTMETVRAAFPAAMIIWIQVFIRYN
jgi:ABC-type Na+ efflux pump permease subunit